MNSDYLERGRSAYRAGDFAAAVQFFTACKDESEVSGEADHLRGNALMKLGRAREAATAYDLALRDDTYGKRGALLTNEGKALTAAGDNEGAVRCFTEALQDSSYATPYKSQLGLGHALKALGRTAEAGTAFRQAAIDGANPAPASALAQLGECFVELGRAEDAVESYRTALDFAGPRDDVHAINAGLGTAYAAANRPSDALDAFKKATADGLYTLSPDEADAQNRAQDALDAASAQNAMAPEPSASTSVIDSTVDPLDPLGKSGEFMPDPSDTGFFTLTESELIQQDRQEMKIRRKHRHTGLKVFFVIVLILAVVVGGLAFAYTRGFGIPSQQAALDGLISAAEDDGDTDQYLASSLSDSAKAAIVSSIPDGSTATITNMDQSMTESTALVTAELSMGGTLQYDVTFVRSDNRIGWVVSSLSVHYDTDQVASDADGTTDDAASDETTSVDNSSATDASTTGADDSATE